MVELDKVLFISNDENMVVGNPTIPGAKVKATSIGESKGDKVIAFKYKSKIRYQRKKGHRQTYTTLSIDEIIRAGA